MSKRDILLLLDDMSDLLAFSLDVAEDATPNGDLTKEQLYIILHVEAYKKQHASKMLPSCKQHAPLLKWAK